jgi:hypothetical protein
MNCNLHRNTKPTFKIAVLPAAIGAATARRPKIKGEFHGAIPRITPNGSLSTIGCAFGSFVRGMVPAIALDVIRAATCSIMLILSSRLICDQVFDPLISSSMMALTSSPRSRSN